MRCINEVQMLTVKGSIQVENADLEIDDYVPFVFRNRDNQTSVPLYWRTGDFKSSLLEIGINPETGAIATVKVPFFGIYEASSTPWKEPTARLAKGLPLCGLEIWSKSDEFKDKFKDEAFAINAIIGPDFASFWLSAEVELDSFYICSQLCIGVDKEKVIRKIDFIDLSGADIERITPRK